MSKYTKLSKLFPYILPLVVLGFIATIFVGFGICTNVTNKLGSTSDDPSCGTNMMSAFAYIPLFSGALLGTGLGLLKEKLSKTAGLALIVISVLLVSFYFMSVVSGTYLDWV